MLLCCNGIFLTLLTAGVAAFRRALLARGTNVSTTVDYSLINLSSLLLFFDLACHNRLRCLLLATWELCAARIVAIVLAISRLKRLGCFDRTLEIGCIFVAGSYQSCSCRSQIERIRDLIFLRTTDVDF